MRLNFTLVSLLLLSFTANAQKLTGIWRGYFSSSNGVYREGVKEETYKYEIQIDQQSNNGILGVTYSYKSTVFYGKAELQGIFTTSSKSLIIKETKLVDLKIGDKSEPCLMTCYLDYIKMGKMEILEGNFISTNVKDKGDCGSGKIYLERVKESDFKKEGFLTKKKKSDTSNLTNTLKNITNSTNTKPIEKPINPPKQVPLKEKAKTEKLTTTNPSTKPPSATKNENVSTNDLKQTQKEGKENKGKVTKIDKSTTATSQIERIPEDPVSSKKVEETITPKIENNFKNIPIPKVLVERENNLVKTITTSEENIQIELYDNGTIDNDTITVYHNNEMVVANRRLSYQPISIKLKCNKSDSRHELIVVAENLGDIPPNTALMVVKAGKERYEIFLASNEQRNAKVIINYVPKE